MKTEDKSKNQLIEELRRRIAELEKPENRCERVEKSLQEAETKYHTIFDNLVEGIYQTTLDGTFVTINSALAHIFGYESPEDFLSKITNAKQLYVEPRHRDELARQVQKYGIMTGFEAELRRKEGTIIWISLNIRTLHDASGRVIGLAGTLLDITERKRAEEQIKKERDRAQKYLDIAGAIIVAIDASQNVVLINKKGCEILGYEERDIVGKNWFDTFIPEKLRNEIKTMFDKFMDGEIEPGGYFENPVLTGYGEERRVAWYNAVLKDGEGKIIASLSSGEDITERRRAEEELRKSHEELETRVRERTVELVTANKSFLDEIAERKRTEEELRKERDFSSSLVQASPTFFVAIDPVGRTLMMNDAMLSALRYTIDEVAGRDYLSNFVPESDRSTLSGIFEQLIKSKKPTINENRVLTKDGRELLIEWHGRPVFKASGDFDYFFGVGIDITESKRIENALRESEDKYKTIFETTGTATVIIEEDTTISLANTGFEKLTGFSKEEVEGKKSWTEFVVREDMERMIQHHRQRRVERKQAPNNYEFRLIDRNGSIRDIFLSISMIPGTKKSIASLLDITERKRALEALQKSESLLQLQINRMPIGCILWNSSFCVESWNPAAEEIFGFKAEEAIGKHPYSLIVPENVQPHLDVIWSRLLEGDAVAHSVNENITKDGHKIICSWSNTPLRKADGTVIGALSMVQDITERRLSEEALKQSEEKYRTLIDNIQDGVFINQDSKIQFANEAFARLGGYTVGEVIGKDFREFIAPEDLRMVADRQRRRLEGEEVTHEYEFHMLHKDGRTRILVNMNVGLITYHGSVASMGTVKDITDKRKLESQLLHAQRMESIGTLAGGIAHDLNNVLTPMMLSLSLLKENYTDEKSMKLLNILQQNSERGAKLINQVLTFSRGAEGEHVTLQVAHLIQEIRQIANETFPRTIEIRSKIPGDLFTVSGDATQLHQVIMNLCVNARDAMPEGGILRIFAENLFIDDNFARINIEAKVGPYIVINVSDTGTGISPKIKDKIFEPFFTTKERGKGTGLGLSTSLGIVKSHGGFITVYSEVGKGTIFKVYLPAITTIETRKAEDRQSELPSGHGETILVVDDEAQIRDITRLILEKHGYKVITANDGKEAVALYSEHRKEIKLVLMDMMMPGMDGEKGIRELQKVNPEIKTIAVSGLAEKDKLEKIANAHVNAFLAKPYTSEKLLKTIHEVQGKGN